MVIASPAAPVAPGVKRRLATVLVTVQQVSENYCAEHGSPSRRFDFVQVRRSAAEAIAALPTAQREGPDVDAAREILRIIAESGLADYGVPSADLALANEYRRRGWAGLMAAMLLVPAWQWPDAPALDDVSPWFWDDYVPYLFAVPQGFSAVGDAERFAAIYLKRLEQLARVAAANRGSAAVRQALALYVKLGDCTPLYFTNEALRKHMAVRGKILAAAYGDGGSAARPTPRAGRRLRVGIVNRHFGPQTETFTTLPTFEHLDPERFDVTLFVFHEGQSEIEKYARQRVAQFRVLPPTVAAQTAELRGANLDVVIFGTNITGVCHEVTRLALQRVAPLQVVNNSSCTTTGFPEIDLYVSGSLTETESAAAHFTERLGLLPGPAHAFNYEPGRQEPTTAWTRAELGLPEDGVVFVTAANYFKIIPEVQRVWAQLLADVPGSSLLVHPFNPNWTSEYPARRFQAEFEAVLAGRGVAANRLVISTNRFPSRSDVKALLSVGDIYLDTFPFGGVNSLVDPLELGMPVIGWEGVAFRSRMGTALLRSLGLTELIATNEEEYLGIAKTLASDPAARTSLRTRIGEAMDMSPLFLDTLAASEAFGALLESAYDELTAVGSKVFRATRTALVAGGADESALSEAENDLEQGRFREAAEGARRVLAAHPASARARHVMGRALLHAGKAERAIAYLLAALQHDGRNGMLWYHLACAYRKNGQIPETLQALEGCLRADQACVDGWLMLTELALQAGNDSLVDEALAMMRQIAPEDPRVQTLLTSQLSTSSTPPIPPPAVSKHVLLYTDDPELGGVAQYNHTLILGLLAAGFRVTCVQSRSDSPLVREQRARGVVHKWIPYDTSREFNRTLSDTHPADVLFGSERPDVIIFSDCCPLSNLAAREVARKAGIPYLTVIGFVGEYLAKNFARYLPMLEQQFAAAQAVIAVSQENLDLLRRCFRLPAHQGQVIYYGRPETFFAPTDPAVRARLRAEIGIPSDAVVCLTTARLAEVKGFQHQLRAFELLQGAAAAEKLHFVWAGEGDQRAKLEQQIAQRGWRDRFHLLGHRWDAADWYDAADIFVLPSHLEGMPLSIMEAMAKSLPVVASAVSGIPDELGDTGVLLPDPHRDPQRAVVQLADAIAGWAADPGRRAADGARCRERAQALFRERRMIEETLTLIAPVVTGAATSK